MNLFQLLEYLGDKETDKFSLHDLLTLTFLVFSDKEVSMSADPLSSNSPYTPLNVKGNPVPNVIREFVNAKMLSCMLCKRCHTRTNVVAPDGYCDADVFVVSDYPDFMEDRTGIPLTGPFEVKASNCMICKNFEECETSKFTRKCEFLIEPSKGITNSNLTFKNSSINSAGRVLADTLVLKAEGGPETFLSTRASWSKFFDRVAPDAETRRKWDVKPKIYVSNVVKCWGPEDPTGEEVDTCMPWLLLERKLSNAPVTLLLGPMSYDKVMGGKVVFEEALEIIQESDVWGKVITYYHPRDIVKWRTEDPRTYEHHLGELGKRLRYIGREVKKTVYQVPDEGEDIE